MSLVGAVASLFRGARYVHDDEQTGTVATDGAEAGRHEITAAEDLRVSRLTGAGSAHSHRLSEA